MIKKNYLHVLWRAPAMVLWILFMPLLFSLVRLTGFKGYKALPHYFHRGVQIILGLRVSFSGEQSRFKPTLFVSNHISYLDVFVLGEVRAYFIAKSEVANWPVLGVLARFQNTLFFARDKVKARQQLATMQEHLARHKSLILFAEGTSTEGTHVETFKSSLFAAANLSSPTQRVVIQPITVAYTHQAGRKMDQETRDYYAWYARMPFWPHFKTLFTLQNVSVKVHFHPVCYLEDFKTRKLCAQHCQKMVADRLNELNSEEPGDVS